MLFTECFKHFRDASDISAEVQDFLNYLEQVKLSILCIIPCTNACLLNTTFIYRNTHHPGAVVISIFLTPLFFGAHFFLVSLYLSHLCQSGSHCHLIQPPIVCMSVSVFLCFVLLLHVFNYFSCSLSKSTTFAIYLNFNLLTSYDCYQTF